MLSRMLVRLAVALGAVAFLFMFMPAIHQPGAALGESVRLGATVAAVWFGLCLLLAWVASPVGRARY